MSRAMSRVLARWLLPLAAAMTCLLAPAATSAAALPAAQAREVRRLVADHLDALAVGDAQRLFAQLTPAVRAGFASSGDFLAMLRAHYPMVYRPRQVGFLPAEAMRDGALQWVEVTDDAGARWLALFMLEPQADAAWGIGGCLVFENPWLPA